MRQWVWGSTELGCSVNKKMGSWYGQYWFRWKIREEEPFKRRVDAILWCKNKVSAIVERLRWVRAPNSSLPKPQWT